MEAFAPGSLVIHSVRQKVHRVGDDGQLLCRARVAENVLKALEGLKGGDDLCQKCFREIGIELCESVHSESCSGEDPARQEEFVIGVSLFPKLPRGAANTSGYFLGEPAYEMSFEPVNCKELETVLGLAIVRQDPVLFDELAAVRNRAVDIDSKGIGNISPCAIRLLRGPLAKAWLAVPTVAW